MKLIIAIAVAAVLLAGTKWAFLPFLPGAASPATASATSASVCACACTPAQATPPC
jgi:hypothetical protein